MRNFLLTLPAGLCCLVLYVCARAWKRGDDEPDLTPAGRFLWLAVTFIASGQWGARVRRGQAVDLATQAINEAFWRMEGRS